MKAIIVAMRERAGQNVRITMARLHGFSPKTIVRYGTAAFILCIAFAYVLYPHWVTLSGFAQRWYTLIPFGLAMFTAILELWYVGSGLR